MRETELEKAIVLPFQSPYVSGRKSAAVLAHPAEQRTCHDTAEHGSSISRIAHARPDVAAATRDARNASLDPRTLA
jgi:hypothetical protein